MIARLTLPLVFVLTTFAASPRAEKRQEAVPVGAFVDVEWRAMGLAGHVSHGPAVAAGVTFFNGTLRLGMGGLNRPGPWNPRRFDVTLEGEQRYRGQRTLSLGSDGGMAGGHIALAFELPQLPLALVLPLTVGYGGFGYYLKGADRNTPDGRRVSEWEDEIFHGRDSHLGMVIDVGVRVALVLEPHPWLRPYAGAYYTTVPGFKTLVRDDYAGFSGALGIEIGHGL